ncbi:MAG TPA: hypothetical protein VGT08_13490 [Terracidiphilus sp.]|nr:hypothetical protein [Terracidiphilus sp.]
MRMLKGPETGFIHGTALTIALLAALVCCNDPSAHSQRKATAQQAGAAAASDPMFKEPYVDVDEWRDKPVRHRYVHGGFEGTNARFSFYFPPKELYQGRFFQYVTPVPASENLDDQSFGADEHMRFSLASGAYFVLTNEGGLSAIAGDQTIVGYRVNASAAEYSRVIAAQMYSPHRPYGYAFGGSGGAFKTISGFEHTDTWDGAVPFVIGSPMAIPNVFTVRLLAMRLLKDKFASIVDATDPGGSGDMYQGLNEEQRDTLREVTRMGFPPGGWFNYKTIGEGAFPVLFPLIRMLDRGYFQDFWKVPGYEGANPSPSLARARIQYATTVVKVVDAADPAMTASFGGVDAAKQLQTESPIGFQMANLPTGSLEGAFVVVQSGDSTGKELPVGRVLGNTVFIAVNPLGADNSKDVKAVKAGDQVVLDNSDFLAAQYYHRHQVPGPDFYVWNQFRGPDGKPLEPQRRMLIGPMVTGAGSVQSGRFKGKMIVVESLMDQDALPWQADWYRSKVKEALGEHLDDNFRLWFTEHALHSDEARQVDTTHTVSYTGDLHQALRDVSAWVEKGVPPPASTNYKVVDGQVVVPATAAERKGIQPVVTVKANGGVRAETAAGKPVKFAAVIEVPPNAGNVVAAEWDFEGEGTFPVAQQIKGSNSTGSGTRVSLTINHVFTKPGTYFPVLRATSQREGDANTPFARIDNLGRVRVVVK